MKEHPMPNATFNPLVQTLMPPPIPMVKQWAQGYDQAFGPILDLSQAVPGYPPHPDLLKMLGEAASDSAYSGYGKIEGETEFRQTYAQHVNGIYGSDLCKDNVHITAGCNQAFIATVMSVAGVGDTVLMSNPYYFNHETTLSMLGIKTRCFDLEPGKGFQPELAKLEASIDSSVRAIILVTPNNPTGATYSASLLLDILELCQSRGIWLLLDETYRDFRNEDVSAPHALFSNNYWKGNLVQLYSFSKSFCIPGHRLGALIGSEELVHEVTKVMDNLQICAPRPPQIAVSQSLTQLESWRLKNRKEIAARAKTLQQVMTDLPDWKISAIGAYFSYIRHPFEGAPSVDVAKGLAQSRGILCVPGEFFGQNQEQYLRIAFANADQNTLRELPKRLQGFTLE